MIRMLKLHVSPAQGQGMGCVGGIQYLITSQESRDLDTLLPTVGLSKCLGADGTEG